MDLISHVVAVRDNIGYASDIEKNGLYEVDLCSGDSKFVCFFPNEDIMVPHLHAYATWLDNRVYFVPQAGENISIFHTDSAKFDTVKIPQFVDKMKKGYSRKMKFAKIVLYKEDLWLFPATYPGIIKLNTKTYEMSLHSNWVPDDGFMFRKGVYEKNGIVYAASGNNNNVLIFDLHTEKGNIIKLGQKNKGIMDMCAIGNSFIMAPRISGPIIKWNYYSNEVNEYSNFPNDFTPGRIAFASIYSYKADIILTPAYANFGVDFLNGNIYRDENVKWKVWENSTSDFIFETDERRYYRERGPSGANRFFYIDKCTNVLEECYFNIINEEEMRQSIIKAAIGNGEMMAESHFCNLQDLIKNIG